MPTAETTVITNVTINTTTTTTNATHHRSPRPLPPTTAPPLPFQPLFSFRPTTSITHPQGMLRRCLVFSCLSSSVARRGVRHESPCCGVTHLLLRVTVSCRTRARARTHPHPHPHPPTPPPHTHTHTHFPLLTTIISFIFRRTQPPQNTMRQYFRCRITRICACAYRHSRSIGARLSRRGEDGPRGSSQVPSDSVRSRRPVQDGAAARCVAPPPCVNNESVPLCSIMFYSVILSCT
jgi:hypothetical protein